MVRTQIQLTEKQTQALKEIAVRRGVSVAELIRQSVDRFLEGDLEAEKWARALSMLGRYHSGVSDVSMNHDKYLDECYL